MSEAVGGAGTAGAVVLPAKAPEAAEVVFRLGCLSARQAALLWPEPYSERSVRYVLGSMFALGLLKRNRCALRYAPGNAHLLTGPVGPKGRTVTWEDVFSLTAEGVRYAAEHFEIPLARARSRYTRSYTDGRREHAYLRNEGYALMAQGTGGIPNVRLVKLEAEGGVGRARMPKRKGVRRRIVEPDGLVVVVREQPDGSRKKTVVFVESDTGTQDSMKTIANKVEGYAEWYLDGRKKKEGKAEAASVEEGAEDSDPDGEVAGHWEWYPEGRGPVSAEEVAEHPTVLFLSPTRRRSDAVAGYLERVAEEYPDGFLRALHKRREEEDWRDGALDVFCTTSLELLRAKGGWGHVFEYLCDEAPGPLL